MVKRSLFVSPPGYPGYPGTSSNPVTTGKSGPTFSTSLSKLPGALAAVYDVLPEAQQQQLLNSAANFASGVVKTVTNSGNNNNNNNNKGGGMDSNSSSSSGHSSGYGLSKAPNPSHVKLDSGIIPNVYTSDHLDATENLCSPLHLSSGKIQFPAYAQSKLYDYFMKIIAFDVQTKAQSNIGFNLNIATDFTPEKIFNAMNSLLSALQIYYCYTSIITYHSDFRNKNDGMIQLRNSLTAEIIEDLYILGRRLSDTPCPPRLLELIRYLNSNFYSGDSQGSPIIKIIPNYLTTTGTTFNTAQITSALSALDTNDNNRVFGLLRRAVPQWIPAILRDVPVTPIYDKNFVTIFANLPFSIQSANLTTSFNFPQVASGTDTVAYNTYTNELDGIAYSLMSVFDTVNSVWLPGLLAPLSTSTTIANNNTRRSYYEIGGVKSFYSVGESEFIALSRQETYNVTDNSTRTIKSSHLFGTDMCMGVSANTIRETAYKVLDHLMSLDTIRTAKTQSAFNPRANSSPAVVDSKPRSKRRPIGRRTKQ